ncbi:MAG: NAD(P)-dependent oxidoreductase [Desulfuromonadaceae bacterium]|nr:NAD(P)-dependent oxidoreductase [Desulfuromonadaceae bacterium]
MLLNVDMSGKAAVIIGGGKVARRKAQVLLASGAQVSVVAPDVVEELAILAQAGRLAVRYGNYEASDLEGMFMVVAATNDVEVNRQVALDAGLKEKMVCVADDSEAGSFSFPAVLHRGNLEIAVSTGGCCPSLAVELRDLVATLITEEYGAIVSELAEERGKLLTAGNPSTYNAQVIRSLARRLISELNAPKDNA